MSPKHTDSTSAQFGPARGVAETNVNALNVVTDPSQIREKARSVSGTSEAQDGVSQTSDVSSERMGRLEGLLEGMAEQQDQFMANQLKMQDQLSRRAEDKPKPPFEHSFNGSSAFTDFIRARDRRMRRGSLDDPMPTVAPTAPSHMPPPNPPPQQREQPTLAQKFVPREGHGQKITKPRDLDWPGFAKFSGKETYTGVGADFKGWGMRFLQRLGAAQLMSGGEWPEDFKILALSKSLAGSALSYCEKMLPVWTVVSNTLEHVMNSMLMLYMTPIPSTKGIELMKIEKDRSRTWPEHYLYLAYVAEQSGNSEQSVLECLCKSATAHTQIAMLTRINAQRAEYLVQAAELDAFAIDFVSTSKQRNGAGRTERSVYGQGGRYNSDGKQTKMGVEGATSHESGPPTTEHAMDAVKPGTLKLIAPRKRAVAARYLEESH